MIASGESTKNPKGQVLVVQLCRMGDLVQTMPLLERLRQVRPDWEITLMAYERFAGVIRSSRLVDHWVLVRPDDTLSIQDGSDPSATNHLIERYPLLARTYNRIINFTHDLASPFMDQLVSADKRGRIGANHPGEIRLAGDWSKYMWAAANPGNRVDSLFNIVDIHVGTAGLPHAKLEDYLHTTRTAGDRARRLLIEAGWDGSQGIVGLQLGASQPHRMWPVEKFAAVGRHLSQAGWLPAVIGGKGERPLADAFGRAADFPHLDLVGRTITGDLSAVLSLCRLVVSNDTGPIHIAAAMGVPVVGIYFSTAYFAETAPYGAGHTVIQASLPCCPCDDPGACPHPNACSQVITTDVVCDVVDACLDGRLEPPNTPQSVTLYRSRFTAGGTLLYEPWQHHFPPENYRWARVHRLMWERALGVSSDPETARQITRWMEGDPVFFTWMQSQRQQSIQTLERYASINELVQQSAHALVDGQSPLILASALGEIMTQENLLDESNAWFPIFQMFHRYVMADSEEEGGVPSVVLQSALHYRQLAHILTCFVETLSQFSDVSPSAR